MKSQALGESTWTQYGNGKKKKMEGHICLWACDGLQ